jgi:hypothetical protein
MPTSVIIEGVRVTVLDTPGVPFMAAQAVSVTDTPNDPVDSSDGGAGGFPLGGAVTFFGAVRNNGGVVQQCSYVATVQPPFAAQFLAAGFTPQVFIVNQNGVAVNQTLMAATTVTGSLPFGTVESNNLLTQDGITNVTRYLVYLA